MNSNPKWFTGITSTPILSPSGIKVTFHFYVESDVTFDAGMTCSIKVTFYFYFGKYKCDVTSWHGDDFRYKIKMSRLCRKLRHICHGHDVPTTVQRFLTNTSPKKFCSVILEHIKSQQFLCKLIFWRNRIN